jgi:hypothetical protein
MGKIVHGGRMKVFINNELVGLFNSATVSYSYGTEPVHILGKFDPASIVLHSVDAVSISCSGFRLAGNGPKILPKVPKVQDLLLFEGMTMTLVDRQTGAELETILNVTPASTNVNYSARASSTIQINYLGTIGYTEAGAESENGSASDLP